MKRQKIRSFLLICSFLLFPITIYYFSPVLIIQGAAQGVISASCVVFLLQMILALFFGRSFCSYICPAGALQEIWFSAKDKKAKLGKRVYIKYVIWIVWLLVILINYFIHKDSLHTDLLFMTTNGVSIGQPMDFIIYYFIVIILSLPALVFGKRATCHYICWMAPFMVLGTKIRNKLHLPGIRIREKKDQCIGCGLCTKACTMSLDVKQMVATGKMDQAECILCGKCVDQCPKKVIYFTMKDQR